MEEKIIKVWFEKGQIWLMTTEDKALSLPLELFPILKEASDVQRESYVINQWGDALRWKELDVDIHISSFYEEVEIKKENEVAALFEKFPQLNVSEVARSLGIHKSLLSQPAKLEIIINIIYFMMFGANCLHLPLLKPGNLPF